MSKMGVFLMKIRNIFVIFFFLCIMLFGEVGDVVVIQPEKGDSATIIVDTESDSDYLCNSELNEKEIFTCSIQFRKRFDQSGL